MCWQLSRMDNKVEKRLSTPLLMMRTWQVAIQLYVAMSLVFVTCVYTDDYARQESALRVLRRCFAYKSSKDTMNCFFEEYDVSTPDMQWGVYELILLIQEVYLWMKFKAELYHHLKSQSSRVLQRSSSLFVEKAILCEVPCLSTALFVAFASCYVFNLEYPKPVKNILYFFKILL